MADDEYEQHNDGYDSEEEFIDDSQFEDPEDYVDSITEDGK